MNQKTISLITAVLVCFATAGHAHAEVQPRLITVTGQGEIMAVPDEVHVNFQVETFDSKLSEAKKANDEAIRAALAIVQKYGIKEKDFQTDYFTVRNEERYYLDEATQQQRSRRGYYVTKNVAVILRDVTKFESLYSDVLEAGVNNINGVMFKSSKAKELREEARTQAAADAKHRAAKLAADLGMQLGTPYTINEMTPSDDWPRPMFQMAEMKAADASAAPTIALGQVKITSSVIVSFELL